MKQRKVAKSFKLFFSRIRRMITQPIFVALTLFGNLVIVTSAYLLFKLEHGINPNIETFLDSLWWSVATVTTVGYGDVVPITQVGRVLGICTVVIGAALFWSYTALFAEAMVSAEINDFESQLRSFQRSLKALEKSELLEEEEIKDLIAQIRMQLNRPRM